MIGAPLSSCALAYYFYLVVIHEQTREDLAKVEFRFLASIFAYSIVTSGFMLFLGMYNHIGAVCWVQGSPPLCGNSVYHPNPDISCDRGDWAWVYGMILFYIPVWICYITIIYINISIYLKIRNTSQGTWYAKQSFYYGLAFCVTWAPSTIWSALQWNDGGSFWIDLASAIFEPLTGFWNLLIFLNNRPKTRERLWKVLLSCLHCQSIAKTSTSASGVGGAGTESDEVMRETPGEVKSKNQRDTMDSPVGNNDIDVPPSGVECCPNRNQEAHLTNQNTTTGHRYEEDKGEEPALYLS